MLSTVLGAHLPIVVTILLGFIAAWHHDFDEKQAATLNRMVLLCAVPMGLFAGTVIRERGIPWAWRFDFNRRPPGARPGGQRIYVCL